jgi:hypothetical protein
MDGAKTMAKLVVACGVVSLWVGAGPTSWAPDLLGLRGKRSNTGTVVGPLTPVGPAPAPSGASTTVPDWFQRAKPFCNAVEVTGYLRADPFPSDWEGSANGAACLALAGQGDRARAVIDALPEEQRWRAAGVVFEAGHPAADAGDDIAAGPLMELVVDYWPNHTMALYHAGAARVQRGDTELGRHYLERFLEHYRQDDGWTRSARDMLGGSAAPAGSPRPAESSTPDRSGLRPT